MAVERFSIADLSTASFPWAPEVVMVGAFLVNGVTRCDS